MKTKKQKIMKVPICAKCSKTLEPLFISEQEEADRDIPEVIIMYGKCEDCNVITVCNIIKTDDIPKLS